MTGSGKIFGPLDVWDDPTPHDAAFNMAADEALLDGLAETALLRIYRWRGPAVSFGYFDPVNPVRAAYPGWDLVRRWTGGGVVEHGDDFTYSLLVPRTDGLTALRAEESYRLLHGIVAAAIAAAAPALPPLSAHALDEATAREPARACFVNAVRHDLLLDGHKIAGAAQRRTRRGWLHQGSVQLPGDTSEVYERLRRTLPAALAVETQARSIRAGEEAAARRLAKEKYGTDAWLQRF